MEHLEAQSYIMPFIDGKVPDSKQSAFVIHMKNCKKCHEEMESLIQRSVERETA